MGMFNKSRDWEKNLRLCLKRLIQGLSLIVIFPVVLITLAIGAILGRKRVFADTGQCLALVPGTIGAYLRWAYYFMTLKRCSWDVEIGFGSFFSSPEAELGKYVYVGAYTILGHVIIGDRVKIASGVSIPSGRHQHYPLSFVAENTRTSDVGIFSPISIGHDAWIGERAVVLADVGPRTIVGAGAVVCDAIPDGCIVAGVPARIVKREAQA